MQTKSMDRDEYYRVLPPNTFAPKKGHQNLDVAIIGAGIAGLVTAIALSESGHNVEVFERSRFANEVGAAISTCPNASRILEYYGFDFDAAQGMFFDELLVMDGKSRKTLRERQFADFQTLYGAPWLLYHRVDLHKTLKNLAFEPRPNVSRVSKLHLLSPVEEVDLDGTLTLANGEKLKKDLIVVADGVHTKFASKVVGAPVRSVSCGIAAFRFLIPTQKLLDSPDTHETFSNPRSVMNIVPSGNVRIVWYPCRRGELQNFGVFHPDHISGYENEAWNIPASQEDLMNVVSEFHPDFQNLCRQAEDLKLWRLLTRAPIDKLTRGNVVLIGDAAHPMLPHQAQGAAMSVEDGAALGVLLSDLKSKDELGPRLKLFEDLRINRVSTMQIFSNYGRDETHKIGNQAEKFYQGPVPTNDQEFDDYCCAPNVIRDAMEVLAQYKAPKTNGT